MNESRTAPDDRSDDVGEGGSEALGTGDVIDPIELLRIASMVKKVVEPESLELDDPPAPTPYPLSGRRRGPDDGAGGGIDAPDRARFVPTKGG